MATKKTSGRSHGFKHKSRSVMTKDAPRGVSFMLREYHVGDRALVQIDPDIKSTLKTDKLTTRDSRSVERKKYGHRKARRSFQFSKR